MSKWNNKQILITGAGSGIGQALARLFAKEGAKLILTDVNEANLNTTANELIHAISISQVADASKKADWQTLAANIKQEVGYLDVLINNAGMTSFGYFD
jgi:NADP-dependent 3-hydroxy acid dehydrogenase YdfG